MWNLVWLGEMSQGINGLLLTLLCICAIGFYWFATEHYREFAFQLHVRQNLTDTLTDSRHQTQQLTRELTETKSQLAEIQSQLAKTKKLQDFSFHQEIADGRLLANSSLYCAHHQVKYFGSVLQPIEGESKSICIKHGYGEEFSLKNSTIYQGMFRKGNRHGMGLWTNVQDKHQIIGEWIEGVLARGIVLQNNGSVQIREFDKSYSAITKRTGLLMQFPAPLGRIWVPPSMKAHLASWFHHNHHVSESEHPSDHDRPSPSQNIAVSNSPSKPLSPPRSHPLPEGE